MHRNWLLSSCASILALASVAVGGGAAAATAEGGTTVDTLVITAERRTENLQTSAISATVLDDTALEAKNVIGLTSLQFAAPGIQISDYSSANTFNIRGIGQSQVDIDLPSGVVIYRDGVPTLTGYFQNAPYYDMASVEVLRGPQGTFVGKSAAAGAVFIRTRDPELGHRGGDITLGFGNHSFGEGTIVFNQPLGDTLALRVAYHGEIRHSLFDSIRTNPLPGAITGAAYDGKNDTRELHSVRVGLLWKPDDHFKAVFKIDGDNLWFGSHATSGLDPLTGDNEDVSNPIVNGVHYYRDKGVRSSLNMSYKFNSGITLNSLTGFSTVHTRADWDSNGSNPAPSEFHSSGDFTNYSQEFNLISPDEGRFRWVTGLFWQKYINHIPDYKEGGFVILNNPASTVPLISTPWQKNELNYAAFGQGAFDITDALELQVGARWSHYEFTQFTQFTLFPGLLDIPFLEPPGGVHQNFKENSFDWKVNLNYKVNDDHFIYALISRGHSPGSINIFPNGLTLDKHTPYHEMKVINYEGGWKGTFFDKRLRTQLAAYYQTFEGYQAGFGIPSGAGVPDIDTIAEFKNAQTTSKIYGVELSAQGRFGDLSFDAGLALSKSKLGSFGPVVNPFAPVYGGPSTIVLAGARTPFAPEVTANAGVAYTFHLSQAHEGLTMTPRFDIAYRSDSYANLFANHATLLEGPTLINVSVRFETGPWWMSIYATNLTDRRYAGAKQNVTGQNGIIEGIVYMAPPRLIGVRGGRSF